jgi:anti-anti-sigma factor
VSIVERVRTTIPAPRDEAAATQPTPLASFVRDAPHCLRISGELDVSNAAVLAAELDEAITVVDCSAVSFIDAAALHVLLRAPSAGGSPVELRSPSRAVRRIMHLLADRD